MDLIFAILSGLASFATSCFAVEAEHMFFKIIFLIYYPLPAITPLSLRNEKKCRG